jgi:hypothetical protein
MPAEEREAFAVHLKEDIELKKLMDEMKLLFVGIQEAALTENLTRFHNGLTEKKSASVFKLGTRWMVAASLFIVASIITWLLVIQENRFEKLYSNYYQPDPGLITAMSATDNYVFEKGMVSYKSREYQAALDSWSPLLIENPSSDTLQYFIGVANQALGRDALAQQHLAAVIKDNTNTFYYDACWYMGLLAVKQGEIGSAKTYLERSTHQQKAKLLNAINSKK